MIAIAHVIQTSVAPVFLLSGVAALLSMLTTRLGRIVDRARVVEAQFPNVPPEREPSLCEELDRMALRARLIGRAITLCTGCALLICAVIVVLFVGAFVDVNLSGDHRFGVCGRHVNAHRRSQLLPARGIAGDAPFTHR